MSEMWVGLILGGLIGTIIALAWYLTDDEAQERRANRRQADWDKHIADVLRVTGGFK